MFVALIRRFHCSSTIEKEGPLRVFEAVPLSLGCIMASGDTCPQGTFNDAVVATLRRHYPERFPAEKD